jgi:hypothetical protein
MHRGWSSTSELHRLEEVREGARPVTRRKGWLTMEFEGVDRVAQYVDTMLLRMKVLLWHRRWRRMKRRFLTGWMSLTGRLERLSRWAGGSPDGRIFLLKESIA